MLTDAPLLQGKLNSLHLLLAAIAGEGFSFLSIINSTIDQPNSSEIRRNKDGRSERE